MNLRELNYILIPRSAESWEQWEASRLGRLMRPLLNLARSFTTEGQIVFVTMLVAAAAGVDVRFSHLYLVFCGLFGLLTAAFLLRPMGRLRAIRVFVEHPPRVTSGEVTTFTIVVRNEGVKPAFALRIRGFFLPWDGEWITPRPSIPVLMPGTEGRVTCQARFLVRGQRILGRFSVGSIRPLGLMMGRILYSPRVILTVVPRVPELAPLDLPQSVRYQPGGVVMAGTAGESYELLGVRPYRAGDRLRDLHARAWARHGEPIVREYRQEYFRRVAVLLDAARPTPRREVFDAAVALTAGVVAQLVRAETLVDLLLAGERPIATTLGCHVGTMEQALDLLAVVEPAPTPQPIDPFIAPSLDRVVQLLYVSPGWDATRAARVVALRASGLQVRVLVVARRREEVAPEPELQVFLPSELGGALKAPSRRSGRTRRTAEVDE